MSVQPGDIVSSWSPDESQCTGVVLKEKKLHEDDELPRFWEILWDDGTVAGEFEDELTIIETNEQKRIQSEEE